MKIATEVHQRLSDSLIIIRDEEGDTPDLPIGSISLPQDEEMVELWRKGLEAINQLLNPTAKV